MDGALRKLLERSKAFVEEGCMTPEAYQEIKEDFDTLELAVAQAVEFAEYVEAHAKGKMEEAARHFLSMPYAQDLKKRITPV